MAYEQAPCYFPLQRLKFWLCHYVTLGKWLKFSVPQFSYYKMVVTIYTSNKMKLNDTYQMLRKNSWHRVSTQEMLARFVLFVLPCPSSSKGDPNYLLLPVLCPDCRALMVHVSTDTCFILWYHCFLSSVYLPTPSLLQIFFVLLGDSKANSVPFIFSRWISYTKHLNVPFSQPRSP